MPRSSENGHGTYAEPLMNIRKAEIGDIPVIRSLADICFRHTYRDILSPEQMEYMMDWMYSSDSLHRQMEQDGHTYYLCFDYDGSPVGYVSVQQEGEDLFHLQKIYLLPERQHSGLGRLLFQTAVSHVKSVHPGPCTIELNVNRNNPAVGFYEHLGMHKARQGDFEIGEGFYMNDYIMSVQI